MSNMGDSGATPTDQPDTGPVSAAAGGKPCSNCQTVCGPDDVFCEQCGFDFVTGSMPGAGGGAADTVGLQTAPAGATPAMPSVLDTGSQQAVGPTHRVVIEIGVDRDYFASVVTEGEVALPTLMPNDQRLELYGAELHIGRTSASRGIHPTIDVEALTGDPAVSSQHALIRVADDGAVTITDVGSTNGTFVGSFAGDPVTQGVAMELPLGLPVYLGAWTRLVVGH